MARLLLLSFLAIYCNRLYGQQMDWLDMSGRYARFPDTTLPYSNGAAYGFEVVEYETPGFFGPVSYDKLYLSKYEKNQRIVSEKAAAAIERGHYDVVMLAELKAGPVIFFYETDHQDVRLYAQLYDESCRSSGEAKLVASTTRASSMSWPGAEAPSYFKISVSDNKRYIGICTNTAVKREIVNQYVVLDGNDGLAQIRAGDIQSDLKSVVCDQKVLNDGTFVVLKAIPGVVTGRPIAALLLYSGPNTTEIPVTLNKPFAVEDIGMRIVKMSNSSAVISGCGGALDKPDEVFAWTVDCSNKILVSEKYHLFMNGTGRTSTAVFDRKEVPADNHSREFHFRQSFTSEGGDVFCFLEAQHITKVVGNSKEAPEFNSIVSYCINSAGDITWSNYIAKRQDPAAGANMRYMSFAAFSIRNKVCILFNDSQKNYDDAGNFEPGGDVKEAHFDLMYRPAVAMVSIDIASGAATRTLENFLQEGGFLIPAAVRTDSDSNGVFVPAARLGGHYYGWLQF